jgi:hypothetical protein
MDLHGAAWHHGSMILLDSDPCPARLAALLETIDPQPRGGIVEVWAEVRRLTAGLRQILLSTEARLPQLEGVREVLASLSLTPLDEGAQRSTLRAAVEALAGIASGEVADPGRPPRPKRRRAAWRRPGPVSG